MKSVIVTHPTGNRNVRAVVSSLYSSNLLAEFYTTLAFNPEASWLKALPKGLKQELMRRTFPVPEDRIWTHPYRELSRMVLPKVGLKSLVQHEKGWACIDSVYRDFDDASARRIERFSKKHNVGALYAYEDGALSSFKIAKKLGLKCIYDLPIAYWEKGKKLMMEESERLPEWAGTLGGGIQDSEEKLDRKTQELELADMVVGPGSFVMDSLPDWAKKKKIVMAPFGSPEPRAGLEYVERKRYSSKPLRVLFVGSMGQRKGLGDLFSAIKLLNTDRIELVVLGSLQAPIEFYRKQLNNFTYEHGRPHDQVLKLMQSCDVFCLPSIVEGRALVMQEAMSQGLPLIITPNTGGSDLIVEGKTGFLVPIQAPEAIAEKLTWFLENRTLIPEMGKSAREHAANYKWEEYGSKIVKEVLNLL